MSYLTDEFTAKVLEAETGVLSCLRSNLAQGAAICSMLKIGSEHFTIPNRYIFAALLSMWTAGEPFDFIRLTNLLRERSELSKWENVAGVQACLYQSAPLVHLPNYCGMLAACHATRTLHTAMTSAMECIQRPEEALTILREALDGLSVTPRVRVTALKDHLASVLRHVEGVSGGSEAIPFGLGLDSVAGPFCRGDLIIIAAQTKKGKSALAGNIVENVALKGGRCVVFGLEMTGLQTAERMLASQSRVDIRSMKLRLRAREQQEFQTEQDVREFNSLQRSIGEMSGWRVDLVEDADSIRQITSEMIRLHHDGGLDVAVVDYAQLCEGLRQKGDNREREVASISRELKRASVQCRCATILLSQLNDDGRLRESRALGQDANCVIEIDAGSDAKKKTIRVVAARSAPDGIEHKLAWNPTITRFSDAD